MRSERSWIFGDRIRRRAFVCTRTSYGECRISLCPSTEEPPSLLWDAGVITIHDNDSGSDAFTATLTPSAETGSYASEMSGILTGGELLTISAQGGSVSGFARTVQLPLESAGGWRGLALG